MSEFGPEFEPTEQAPEEPVGELPQDTETAANSEELHRQMSEIVDQIESGQELTADRYGAYQELSEQFVDQSEGDRTLNVFQHDFACAYLKLLGGMDEAALADFEELAEAAGYGDNTEVVEHCNNMISEIIDSQKN